MSLRSWFRSRVVEISSNAIVRDRARSWFRRMLARFLSR
jgi:hypothetical protein